MDLRAVCRAMLPPGVSFGVLPEGGAVLKTVSGSKFGLSDPDKVMLTSLPSSEGQETALQQAGAAADTSPAALMYREAALCESAACLKAAQSSSSKHSPHSGGGEGGVTSSEEDEDDGTGQSLWRHRLLVQLTVPRVGSKAMGVTPRGTESACFQLFALGRQSAAVLFCSLASSFPN